MSRFYSTYEEEECYKEGRRDEELGRPSYEHDRYSSCSCDRAYFEGRGDEERHERERREEREAEERAEERACERRAEERRMEEEAEMEAQYYAELDRQRMMSAPGPPEEQP